jgi:hypothetical protein
VISGPIGIHRSDGGGITGHAQPPRWRRLADDRRGDRRVFRPHHGHLSQRIINIGPGMRLLAAAKIREFY